MNKWVRSIVVGIPFILLGLALPYQQAVVLFAVLLGVAAGVYPGFAMQHPKEGEVVEQSVVALLLSGLAWLGVWLEPALVGLAWLLHAGWDFLHHRSLRRTPTPGNYAFICLVVDVQWGILVLGLRAAA